MILSNCSLPSTTLSETAFWAANPWCYICGMETEIPIWIERFPAQAIMWVSDIKGSDAYFQLIHMQIHILIASGSSQTASWSHRSTSRVCVYFTYIVLLSFKAACVIDSWLMSPESSETSSQQRDNTSNGMEEQFSTRLSSKPYR